MLALLERAQEMQKMNWKNLTLLQCQWSRPLKKQQECTHCYFINCFISIYDVHNASKEKSFELEMSWICEQSQWKHQLVPMDLLCQAEDYAKASLEEKMQE